MGDTKGRGRAGCLVLVCVAAGCTGGSTAVSTASTAPPAPPGSAAYPCTPLEGTEPITLANVIGAGRDTDGTIYAVDDGAPGYRAFVSVGTVLQRKPVPGAAGGPGSQSSGTIVVFVGNGTAPLALKIERLENVVTRMALHRAPIGSSFTIDAEDDVLELVGADVLKGLAVENIPPSFVVEHDATTTDGHRLLVLQSTSDATRAALRVFYGAGPTQMMERLLVAPSSASPTYLAFSLDGVEADATFSPVAGSPASLRIGDRVLELDPVDAGVAALAGVTFTCVK